MKMKPVQATCGSGRKPFFEGKKRGTGVGGLEAGLGSVRVRVRVVRVLNE
jgi:hypothetical protein